MNPNQYTQICKIFIYITSKGAYNQNSTKSDPSLSQNYIKKEDSSWPLESKKDHSTTNIYISSKALPILGSSSSISPSKH